MKKYEIDLRVIAEVWADSREEAEMDVKAACARSTAFVEVTVARITRIEVIAETASTGA